MFEFLDFLFGSDKHRFSVMKAYCTPSRIALTQTLQPYGVNVFDVSEQVIHNDLGVPSYVAVSFFVSKKQANWTEYLLFRSKQFVVADGFVNRVSNERWAAKHSAMPRPWSSKGGVWVEKSCKQAAFKQSKKVRR